MPGTSGLSIHIRMCIPGARILIETTVLYAYLLHSAALGIQCRYTLEQSNLQSIQVCYIQQDRNSSHCMPNQVNQFRHQHFSHVKKKSIDVVCQEQRGVGTMRRSSFKV